MHPTFRHRDIDPETNRVASEIVDAFIDVRRSLGAGLLEGAYHQALVMELRARGLDVNEQKWLDIEHRGQRIDRAYKIDLVVEDRVLIELKAVEDLHPRHFAQCLTYLRLSGLPVGFLVNFNAVPLYFKRLANTRGRRS